MCGLWITLVFFFKQKTAYEMRISDWSSDVCSSDLASVLALVAAAGLLVPGTATAGEKPAVDLALMLAVDISGSIDLDEARLQREGYAQAISDPAVFKAITSGINGRIAVAYFEWSDSYTQNALLAWTVISENQK